ncbi:MAG: hypothetical protein RLZZ618_3180 [Pseudomonadota bacterium]
MGTCTLLTGVLLAATVCLSSGCSSLGYYSQSVGGHVDLLNKARPVPEWLADAKTPAPLRERLVLSDRLRNYAVTELKLPDNASYRRYADLQRPAAVWNVAAAPELSLALRTWCFPVVGCVGYRGYFDKTEADQAGAELRAEGLEVTVYPVPAYSTLGKLPGDFFADPLLSTFIRYPEGDLARLIFHELAHQVAYADGDTEFNESFATAVEHIGGQRWLAAHASPEVRADFARSERRREDFRVLTLRTRQELDAVFRSTASDADKREAKAAVMVRMRADYAALKAGPWLGFAGYDAWFERANNGAFGILGAYFDLVPQFEALFVAQGSDFDRFYAEVQRLARLPFAERRATLAAAQRAPS